jgi:CRP-like cAMP-binding protein
MVLLLLKEEREANSIPEEQKALFQSLFEPKGMRAVDFLSLISIAEKREVKKGEKVIDESRKNKHVYLVVRGDLAVHKMQQRVGSIHKNQFVGAMSYLTWENEYTNREKNLQNSSSQDIPAVGDTVGSVLNEKIKENVALSVEKDASQKELVSPNSANQELDTANAGANVTKEGLNLSTIYSKTINYSVGTWSYLLSYIPPLSTSVKSVTSTTNEGDAPIDVSQQDLDSNTEGNAIAGEDEHISPLLKLIEDIKEKNVLPASMTEDGQQGRADVIAETDCTLFAWKFKQLHQLIQEKPLLGYVFEKSISDDLNKKMSSSWEEEMKIRYRQLLLGALIDGEVSRLQSLFTTPYL